MFHIFDNNDHEYLQILGNMALYKIPMRNETMDQIMGDAMPVLVCMGFSVLAIIGAVLPVVSFFAG